MRFKELSIGQTFDWVGNNTTQTSYHRPCVKTSARKYRTCGKGPIEQHTVGSINAVVFNVNKYD